MFEIERIMVGSICEHELGPCSSKILSARAESIFYGHFTLEVVIKGAHQQLLKVACDIAPFTILPSKGEKKLLKERQEWKQQRHVESEEISRFLLIDVDFEKTECFVSVIGYVTQLPFKKVYPERHLILFFSGSA